MDAEALKNRLIGSGIARPEDILGCAPEEIAQLEARFGPLPDSYKAILMAIGKGAGRLVDDHAHWIYFDQIPRINRRARDVLDEYAEDDIDPDVPEEAVFISAEYGEARTYLLARGGADSAVWALDYATGRGRKVHDSVWDWIEGFVTNAETAIAEGAEERNSRRAEEPS